MTCSALPSIEAAERVVEPALLRILKKIGVTVEEKEAALRRARDLQGVLIKEFHGSVYLNGSVSHGDALTPLDDVDLGVVIDGPIATVERANSPAALMGRASRAIEAAIPGATAVFANQKRAIVVDFKEDEPSNFTADVIVALQYDEGSGVLVPNLLHQRWDRSDPLRHSDIVRSANLATGSALNRIVRLAKAWNRQRGKPLSSWNIKALALECITSSVSLTAGLHTFFHYAAESIAGGLTRDPAGVSVPIALELPKAQVLIYLEEAAHLMDTAIRTAEANEQVSTDCLAMLLQSPSASKAAVDPTRG